MPRQLTLLPPAKPRLGLYLRPGRNDHTVFLQLLSEGRSVSGLVLDARHRARHAGLLESLIDNGVHAILDPDFMEMATVGGHVLAGLDDVPWSELAGASGADLRSRHGHDLATRLAEVVRIGEYSAVLAPTHLLSGAADEMFGADRTVATLLRARLDERGLRDVAIFYPLAIPASLLRDQTQRTAIASGLRSIDVDALWLRVHPFGTSTAGPLTLRRYIEAGWDLQRIGIPLVSEHSGTVGLALMAFGAVGGIESGITIGEQFDAAALTRPRDPNGKPFSPPPRVYLDAIGALVSRKTARQIFENRQMIAALGCRDGSCCPRGIHDMIKDPRRHFVLRRTANVDQIGSVPPRLRPSAYVQDVLRPAALLAVRAARVSADVSSTQRRLESWNLTLSALSKDAEAAEAIPALGQRIWAQRGSPRAVR